MPQLTQGLIVAVLIGLLLAIIVGYYLRQSQVNELSEALHQSQQRQADLAQEHEQRLREATLQLQTDYEAQLTERMERYQAQYDEQRSQMEAEYQARQAMMGGVSGAGEVDSSIEQRIRKQYETRLKEAATKIQQAYEQHLQEKLVEARSQAQQDYDQRLAAAIAHYQDEAARLVQDARPSLGALVPEPFPAETASSTDLTEMEARLQAQYDQRLTERLAEYQDDMAQRLAQMEQDYEARLQMAQASSPGAGAIAASPSAEELELNLRRELEASLREEYEQKLAEKIEHYQDELTQRTQELEQSYEAQLRLLQSVPSEPPAPMADAGEFDLDRAIAAANAATLATNLEAGLDLNDAFPSPGSAAPPAANADLSFDADLVDSDLESVQNNEFVLDPDSDTENLETASLNLEETLSSETAAPFATDADLGFDAALLDSDLENAQGNEFDLATAFDPETFETTSLESGLDLEGTFPPEPAAPSAADTDLDFDAALLDNNLENAQGNEFDLASGFDSETFEIASPEPSLDLEGTFPPPEPAAPSAADTDLDFDAALLDSDLENAQGNEFDLDLEGAFAAEPPAPPTASADTGFDDFLAGDLESAQGDEFALDPEFEAETLLDLDALLNPLDSDNASDDMLNSLDDLSDLS
ncbi:hypothetical protein IQ265_20650 [Nodosilinea sp. LEGE 06152]|uniref:hypothetical protein n=1 Tax=Nodosilinea sp. LEGE 06152 TaxID=2777966 RepID=UPI00187E9F7D|nr:hypothetical protein [Nodosilinea sp. LEGE 06152]MBE9159226.1 hypothetical protein [Nodosilinea sp. LEGE 06152]